MIALEDGEIDTKTGQVSIKAKPPTQICRDQLPPGHIGHVPDGAPDFSGSSRPDGADYHTSAVALPLAGAKSFHRDIRRRSSRFAIHVRNTTPQTQQPWRRKVRPSFQIIRECFIWRSVTDFSATAKSRIIIVRLLSMAATGYFYTFTRPRTSLPMSMLKYDPIGTDRD